jgi:proline dehydrogenase
MKNKRLISLDNTSVAFASKTDKELKKIHFLFLFMNWEHLTKIGTKIVKTALELHFPVRNVIKRTLFKQFCGGETLEECEKVVSDLNKYQIHTILDYSVEGEDREENFEKTVNILDKIIEIDAASEAVSHTVIKLSSIASPLILEKIQQGTSLNTTENEIFEKIKQRLDKICRNASEKKVKLLIDAEESWIQGAIDVLVFSMMSKYNREEAYIFNTFQMYRRDMLFHLDRSIKVAEKDGFFLGVKLVRGAYMKQEKDMSQKKRYPSPLFDKKEDTDDAFNKGMELCIQNISRLELCCGTHNEDSTLQLAGLMEDHHITPPDKRIYFSQLYGMGDHISYNLALAGYNVTKYLPFGPLESVLPYLFRRAHENKSLSGKASRELELIKKELKRRNVI